MNWIFTPKYAGKPLAGLEISFNGTRKEAYTRACNLAAGLAALIGNRQFSVRVDRTDREALGYEVGPDGHTIDQPNKRLTPTTSKTLAPTTSKG